MASGVARRDEKKEAQWRRHVQAQASGGVSIRAFCKARGISEPSFHGWRRELRRRDAQKAVPAFVPVEVTALPTAASALASASVVEILLPGEQVVRLRGKVDRRQLADVLAVLGEVRPRGTTPC